ncbi:UbiA prenyltransferase family protein [Krasilnikovia sp. MM14-A1259]|uniref:UbiA prenyltransferase family protein n=1 Tax=Krasilnikovia sp. MM14-A1259 TaxID=3373539 RepID=UPI00399D1D5D
MPVSDTLVPDIPRRPHWRALLALIRPGQWSKNLFAVPLALLSDPVLPWDRYIRLAWITGLFLLASALVYVLNDYADRRRDQAHPIKRHRPIASGEVSPAEAIILGLALAGGLLGMTIVGPTRAAWPAYLYLVLNVAYSCGLKNVPLLDVLIVSCGFVLRAVAGCVVLGISLSGWLALAVFTGSLLLSLGKRRHEMIQASAEGHRPALGAYSIQLLDHLILLNSGIVLMATMTLFHTDLATEYGRAAMMFSAPFAVLLIFRYLQVVFVVGGGAEPTRLLIRDRPIVGTAALWAVALIALRLAEWAGVQWVG